MLSPPIGLLEEAHPDAVKTLGASHPFTRDLTNKLAEADVAGGRTRDAVPLLATLSAASLKDTPLTLKVAALQAWFGMDVSLWLLLFGT
jgi:hypothetical protein